MGFSFNVKVDDFVLLLMAYVLGHVELFSGRIRISPTPYGQRSIH